MGWGEAKVRLKEGTEGHGDPATCVTMLETGGPCRECDERAALQRVEELERENAEAAKQGFIVTMEWKDRAEAAEAEVKRLEGLIVAWAQVEEWHPPDQRRVGIGMEARRIRERVARNA